MRLEGTCHDGYAIVTTLHELTQCEYDWRLGDLNVRPDEPLRLVLRDKSTITIDQEGAGRRWRRVTRLRDVCVEMWQELWTDAMVDQALFEQSDMRLGWERPVGSSGEYMARTVLAHSSGLVVNGRPGAWRVRHEDATEADQGKDYIHLPDALDRAEEQARSMDADLVRLPEEKRRKVAKLIEDIADTHFGIVTLRERKVDRLDFYEVHVHSIREALKAAYEAGKNAARADEC